MCVGMGVEGVAKFLLDPLDGAYLEAEEGCVQLHDQGRQCRVRLSLEWGKPLPTGFMVICGP